MFYVIKLKNHERYLCTDSDVNSDGYGATTDYFFMAPEHFVDGTGLLDRLVIFGNRETAAGYMLLDDVIEASNRAVTDSCMEVITLVNLDKIIEDELLT